MDLIGIRTLPTTVRRNYLHEFHHTLTWSLLAGLLEGPFAAVVVAKSFQAGETLIAIAAATPTAANLFSLLWGLLSVGRPKIRLAIQFAAGVVVCAATVGIHNRGNLGSVFFVIQVAAAQVFLAGVVTVRSAIWKSNYPHAIRGRVTARLQGVRFVASVASSLLAAFLADRNPASYAYVYPLGALFGAVSLVALSRIRIRGEQRELLGGGPNLRPMRWTSLLSPGHVLGRMISVLRDDPTYRRYCLAQMLTGSAHLMTISIAVAIVTRGLVPGDESGFWISVVLLDALPKAVMLGSLGRWGLTFDRLGVLGMRTLNLVCWMASIGFGLTGDLLTPELHESGPMLFTCGMILFTLRSLATGLAQGGGAVAWSIGHLHFARPEDAEVYMGIHVSLTGLRGLIAPVGGMLLWRAIGWPVWLLALGSAFASFRIYSSMAKEESQSQKAGALAPVTAAEPELV